MGRWKKSGQLETKTRISGVAEPEAVLASDAGSQISYDNALELKFQEEPKFQPAFAGTKFINCLLLTLFIYPLFYGGKHELAHGLILTLILGLFAVVSGGVLWGKIRGSVDNLLVLSRLNMRIAFLGMLFVVLLCMQLIPLPLSFLGYLSEDVAEIYRVAGAKTATLSLNKDYTLQSILNLSALFLSVFAVISFPQILKPFAGVSKRRLRKAKRFSEPLYVNSIGDMLSERIQTAIIYSGVISALIAFVHYVGKINLLFGIFDPKRAELDLYRAHWPFVNPNHLAAFIEMSLVLALGRFLRLRLLKRLDISRTRQTLWQQLRDVLLHPGGEAFQLMSIFILSLVSVLTMSKMGVFLSLSAVYLITVYYQQVSNLQDKARQFSSVNHSSSSLLEKKGSRRRFLRSRRFPPSQLQALIIIASIAVIFYLILGDVSRGHFAARLQYGIANIDQTRKGLMLATIQSLRVSPVLGVGAGCWSLIINSFVGEEFAGWTLDFAHNDYLQLLSETGIAGGIIVLAVIIIVLKQTILANKKSFYPVRRMELVVSSLALLLPLTHACVDFPFHLPAISFAFFMLLARHLRLIEFSLKDNRKTV